MPDDECSPDLSNLDDMQAIHDEERHKRDAATRTLLDTLTAKFEAPEKPQFKMLGELPKNMQDLANSPALSAIVFTCVVLNGIQMGVQEDYDLGDSLMFLDHLFTAVFASEMVIKLVAWRLEYFRSAWNVFDCFLTNLSILDVWILAAMGGGQGMKMFAVLRILRVFRVVRLLRMVKSLRELTLILQGFIDAMRTAVWVSLLLMLLLYIFAIFCTSTVGRPGIYEGHNEENVEDAETFNSYQFFGTIPRSMFTLLNCVMLSDDWYMVSRAMLEKQPAVLFLLVGFLMITSVGLMGTIGGIIVENVITSADSLNSDDDTAKRKELLAHLQRLYAFVFELDLDGSGSLDADELAQAWDREEMQDLLSVVNLPIGANAQELVDLIDTDGNNELEMSEFVQNMVRLLTNSMLQHILEIKSGVNRVLREVRKPEAEEEKPHPNEWEISANQSNLKQTKLGELISDSNDQPMHNMDNQALQQMVQQLKSVLKHLEPLVREHNHEEHVQQHNQHEMKPEPHHRNLPSSQQLHESREQQFQNFQQQLHVLTAHMAQVLQLQRQHQTELSQLNFKQVALHNSQDRLNATLQEVTQLLRTSSGISPEGASTTSLEHGASLAPHGHLSSVADGKLQTPRPLLSMPPTGDASELLWANIDLDMVPNDRILGLSHIPV
eukprot:gnl/MRDRNA2_/MRDRNA2_83882_c0_seq1.p1 gnl/MRDRNA2_/MRDRNA2_83882_c0~~gnl/MRDRNA2_/MRDRNA2_83882_c0_seq1.p1  ORF type:complete len:665 (-),score=100.53 gnl/MRDRNA2_/MRDRNA2_83882_c0_seq1:265-2259(-)